VRSIVFKLAKGDAPGITQMNARVRELIAEVLKSDGIEEIYALDDAQIVANNTADTTIGMINIKQRRLNPTLNNVSQTSMAYRVAHQENKK